MIYSPDMPGFLLFHIKHLHEKNRWKKFAAILIQAYQHLLLQLLNPLYPNISRHIFQTVLQTFLRVLTTKVCLTLLFPPILKSLVVPVIWLALINAIYSKIAPFFALNRIFFPANEATLKTKQLIRFQGLFKVTNQIAGKWKTKSIM